MERRDRKHYGQGMFLREAEENAAPSILLYRMGRKHGHLDALPVVGEMRESHPDAPACPYSVYARGPMDFDTLPMSKRRRCRAIRTWPDSWGKTGFDSKPDGKEFRK